MTCWPPRFSSIYQKWKLSDPNSTSLMYAFCVKKKNTVDLHIFSTFFKQHSVARWLLLLLRSTRWFTSDIIIFILQNARMIMLLFVSLYFLPVIFLWLDFLIKYAKFCCFVYTCQNLFAFFVPFFVLF